MLVENIPEIYIGNQAKDQDLFVYDYKMTEDIVKTKVNLGMHLFSFLQTGKKQVHCANSSIAVNEKQSLLIKKGSVLWTELPDTEDIYYCKMLFFSEKALTNFLLKHASHQQEIEKESPYFIIENDHYIASYITSLSSIITTPGVSMNSLLSVKFEEIMLYLKMKYQSAFEQFLQSLISKKISPFKKVIESNLYSNLKLEEIAFLCNMSLSTFKRHFIDEYHEPPGKWLQNKRLLKAKEILAQGQAKPSEIYLDFGYNNLSNFSVAFKNKFGVSPKKVYTSNS